MKINNIYEDYSGERLYSVLLDENELSLFSEAKEETKEKSRGLKGSLIGAGIGAGISAAALGSILGLGKIADKKKRQLDDEFLNHLERLGDHARRGNDEKAKELEDMFTKTHYPKRIKYWKSWHKIRNLRDSLKENPGKASAIAAGVLALGAGTGYGVSKLKNRKRNEE